MASKLDLIGQRFGRLVVIEDVGMFRASWGTRRAWRCRCDCGEECTKPTLALRSGYAQSCGCFRREVTGAARRKHGGSSLSSERRKTYLIWKKMRGRCQCPTDQGYSDYGGRGIAICHRWQDYAAFESDMGLCPSGHSIERKNVNGNYEPDNCEWLPKRLQSRNRRDTRYVVLDEKMLSLAAACESIGISANYVHGLVYRRKISHQAAFDWYARKKAA